MKSFIKVVLLILLCAFNVRAGHVVTLTWNPSPTVTVTGYQVFRGLMSGGEGSTPINAAPVASGCTNTQTCTYQDTSVEPGQTYFYYVESYDGTNFSVPSNEISLTVPVSPVQGLTIIQSN